MEKRVKEYLETVIEIEREELDAKYEFEDLEKLTPIEQIFLIAAKHNSREAPFYVQINRQEQIGKYRVDFFIWSERYPVNGGKAIHESVIVECDGHDYHERTKEQASSDKKRDRELQKLGHNVFRFTGSDLWKDPDHCAREVITFLINKNYK